MVNTRCTMYARATVMEPNRASISQSIGRDATGPSNGCIESARPVSQSKAGAIAWVKFSTGSSCVCTVPSETGERMSMSEVYEMDRRSSCCVAGLRKEMYTPVKLSRSARTCQRASESTGESDVAEKRAVVRGSRSGGPEERLAGAAVRARPPGSCPKKKRAAAETSEGPTPPRGPASVAKSAESERIIRYTPVART